MEGLQTMQENGVLFQLSRTHASSATLRTHTSALFGFFHMYLTWELETQIRALGGKFKCFAMLTTRSTGIIQNYGFNF